MTTGIRNLKKAGQGWTYDESDMTYDNSIDPKSGEAVLYDSIGTAPVITNLQKSTLS